MLAAKVADHIGGYARVFYRDIRVVGRLAGLGYGPNASGPTVFLCSAAPGANAQFCRR